MFSVCQLSVLCSFGAIALCAGARRIGLCRVLAPPLDERKASADAARSYGEDGMALASSPRLVIRGETVTFDGRASPQVRDGA